ncbi:hypothetical protein ACT2FY_38165 [Paraburkholderia fungorum]|uniref:hypothetical protein n=1 Tax=Paraburkholderia fungorum TaxID=134537 RepID=UPI00402B504E
MDSRWNGDLGSVASGTNAAFEFFVVETLLEIQMNNQSVTTGTVGYMGWALASWLLSMPNAGWFDRVYGHGLAIAWPLAVILGVMGILSFMQSRSLDSIIFFGGAGLFWSMYTFAQQIAAGVNSEPGTYAGWYYLVWAVFFCYVWLGSFKAGLPRILFLLALWLTLLALAIGNWGGPQLFLVLGGYLGLLTAILAAITSAITVIMHGRASEHPNGTV